MRYIILTKQIITRHTLIFFTTAICALLCSVVSTAQNVDREKMLRDSTMKYGVEIEPFLKSLNNGKIVKDFNYSPHINKFLKKNKYVKFPPYAISIGIDPSYEGYKRHISPVSGNRLYFPKGSALVTPTTMKTNSYMCFLDWVTKDVFIDGINLVGSKANKGYETSMYGCGIAMYAAEKIIVANAAVTKSSGDGLAVRVHWNKQSKDIIVNKLAVNDATRVGMLITGIINGSFNDISIEGTGEEDQSKVVKPQTALSFEPNDCTSKYVNCKFNNLSTTNNLGPILATTNFWAIFKKNTCGPNKIDVTINGWNDFTDSPAVYGASLSIAGGDLNEFANTQNLSGTFIINNATITRNTPRANYYFFQGANEPMPNKGGIKYELNNLKLIHQGKSFTLKNKDADEKIKAMIDTPNRKNKLRIN